MATIDTIISRPDAQDRLRTIDDLVDGVVTRATPTRLWFTVGGFDGGVHEFGGTDGARYPRPVALEAGDPAHSHMPAPPAAGTHLVAAFMGGDVDQPRVLAVYQ